MCKLLSAVIGCRDNANSVWKRRSANAVPFPSHCAARFPQLCHRHDLRSSTGATEWSPFWSAMIENSLRFSPDIAERLQYHPASGACGTAPQRSTRRYGCRHLRSVRDRGTLGVRLRRRRFQFVWKDDFHVGQSGFLSGS